MKTLLSIAGRIVYALPIGVFGLFHFMNASAMAGMVPSWIPGGIFWIYLTGAALIAAAISIIIRKKAALASFLLGVMLLIFAITIHLPGMIAEQQISTTMFLKDAALAGAAFFISAKI